MELLITNVSLGPCEDRERVWGGVPTAVQVVEMRWNTDIHWLVLRAEGPWLAPNISQRVSQGPEPGKVGPWGSKIGVPHSGSVEVG